MSWNGNDIQFLSIIDRVKRLEVSTLKKVLGKYVTNETNLTTLVEGLQSSLDNLEYVKSITWNDTTFSMTITNEDDSTLVIDLPLEQMIVDVTYDDVEKELIFELNNGTTLVVPLSDIIDGLVKTSDIVDNLTTDDANKVLSAKQGKVLQDGKLDKVTSTSSISRAYTITPEGNQGIVGIASGVAGGVLISRRGNSLFDILSGNSASRPTTSLAFGHLYFNTDTKQLEVYIGDANHWLNQVYKNGDTLPTPASGTSHTYHVISDGTGLGGSPIISIDSESVWNAGATIGTTLVVTNDGGVTKILNLDNSEGTVSVSNLTISATNLALKRVA